MSRPEVRDLLEEHLRNMQLHSPPESMHALNLEEFRDVSVTLWTAWDEGDCLLGCGALKQMNDYEGEVKSIKTSDAHMRKGVARFILNEIINTAKRRGYHRLYLETGSMLSFVPACRLYESFGFSYCGPFGIYEEDPYSLFMMKDL